MPKTDWPQMERPMLRRLTTAEKQNRRAVAKFRRQQRDFKRKAAKWKRRAEMQQVVGSSRELDAALIVGACLVLFVVAVVVQELAK